VLLTAHLVDVLPANIMQAAFSPHGKRMFGRLQNARLNAHCLAACFRMPWVGQHSCLQQATVLKLLCWHYWLLAPLWV